MVNLSLQILSRLVSLHGTGTPIMQVLGTRSINEELSLQLGCQECCGSASWCSISSHHGPLLQPERGEHKPLLICSPRFEIANAVDITCI